MSNPTSSIDRRALLASTAAALVLTACSNIIGPPEASPLYVLDPANPTATGGPPVVWQLSIVLPEAPDSLDTVRIALLQPNGQLDYYANSNWQDRLPFLVQSSLVEAFEASGRTPGVGRDSEGIKSDYLLVTDIRALEARYDVADAPPMAQVRIEAKLINAHTRTIVLSSDAHSEVRAAQNSVLSVVAAMNRALADVQSQIVTWVLTAPPPKRA
jgi:cholesterol transport system auxiliary component